MIRHNFYFIVQQCKANTNYHLNDFSTSLHGRISRQQQLNGAFTLCLHMLDFFCGQRVTSVRIECNFCSNRTLIMTRSLLNIEDKELVSCSKTKIASRTHLNENQNKLGLQHADFRLCVLYVLCNLLSHEPFTFVLFTLFSRITVYIIIKRQQNNSVHNH